jgi:hypothetical protein
MGTLLFLYSSAKDGQRPLEAALQQGQLEHRLICATALLACPGPRAPTRIRRHLGQPQITMRTRYRRVRQVAIRRRPKLTACGDPARDQAVAVIMAC